MKNQLFKNNCEFAGNMAENNPASIKLHAQCRLYIASKT